jgi:glycosyltransferase involved in cell wall biosynthesis
MDATNRPTRPHVVFLSWRDTSNPEGGGAERYLERMAAGLVARGYRVTVFSAAYPGAVADETVDGIRFVRKGSKLSVYLVGALSLLTRRFGRVDLVVDVQNGLPFFSRLVTRRPVVVLVHHVHREQWPVVYPGLVGKVGWWVEHWVAPRLYRHCQYVAVSLATRSELQAIGVDGRRIAVVHNGTDPVIPSVAPKSATPMVAVVGRLVPHKRVEHAIESATRLHAELPGLRLHVVGDGWWQEELERFVVERGAGEVVVFEGQVDEVRKHELYQQSWVLALPSLKEGWGLVVGEAGMHRTPTVAYRAAGGTRESVIHGYSGLLVGDQDELTRALRRVLEDADLRSALGEGAESVSHRFTWSAAQESFAAVVEAARHRSLVGHEDPGTDGAPGPAALSWWRRSRRPAG